MIDLIYHPDYLHWQLGKGHPTNPVRALNTLRLIEASDIPHVVREARPATIDELTLVHSRRYVTQTLRGNNSQWSGRQRRMGQTARLMAGGTMRGVDRILAGESKIVFNPQGAKHHALRDTGSGFCAFNDMAMAAWAFAIAGLRTLYIDWDVHQGDGVEELTWDLPECMTVSFHGINMGRPDENSPEHQAYNIPLHSGSDGSVLLAWLESLLVNEGAAHKPDVILLAAGADGHRYDRLGNLRYTTEDIFEASQMVREFADIHCQGRVLAGGAGGYQPHDWTPRMWLATVDGLTRR